MRDEKEIFEQTVLQTLAKLKRAKIAKFHVAKTVRVSEVDSDGWTVRLANIQGSQIHVSIWYDRYLGNKQRYFWFGFESRKPLNILLNNAPHAVQPRTRLTRKDYVIRKNEDGDRVEVLKDRPSLDQLKYPFDEQYGSDGCYFGFYSERRALDIRRAENFVDAVLTSSFREPIAIEIGKTISNRQLVKLFSVGNMGGMRRSHKKDLLVIVSDKTKGLYIDRWDETKNILHYTGMGTTGPQGLNYAQNKTLAESPDTGIPVHLFQVDVPGRYIYLGEVELVDKPYEEKQPDVNGRLRSVWMFPLRLRNNSAPAVPSIESVRELDRQNERKVKHLTTAQLKKLAKRANGRPPKRPTRSDQFARNPHVSLYVKRRADGRCDLCQQPAPFRSRSGEPYLHCHHVIWLAQDGPDIIQNAVALCPNCHSRMHELDLPSDKMKLGARIKQRDPDLKPFICNHRDHG